MRKEQSREKRTGEFKMPKARQEEKEESISGSHSGTSRIQHVVEIGTLFLLVPVVGVCLYCPRF